MGLKWSVSGLIEEAQSMRQADLVVNFSGGTISRRQEMGVFRF